MRKLILSMVVSIDGYINAAGGEFVPPDWSQDLDRWTYDMMDRFDTLLYGRTAWEQMAAYWPQAESSPETSEAQRKLATFMNSSRKIVFSHSSVDSIAWANSEVADRSVTDIVQQERGRAGRDMVIFAGARFAKTVMQANLVNEYWLLTVPELFGHGTRLFDGHCLRARLQLNEVRQMDTGAVLTRYSAQ